MTVLGEYELEQRLKFNRVRNAQFSVSQKNKQYTNKVAFREFLKYHKKNKNALLSMYENQQKLISQKPKETVRTEIKVEN